MNPCPACSHSNPTDARFCNQCGQGLAQATDSTPAASSPIPNPGAYTPRHLAERILNNAATLKGERKQVTVLFADVKGSTRLAEQAGAERWHEILDRLFSLLSAAVHRFEGSVNQYTGDGIMALFGAPIAHEDHALRAAHAALEIREKVRGFADELRLRDGLNLSVRVGLNSGEVIVGAIGDDLRMDYTAQGHTVNLAARMESIAEPGRVYLTRHTARLLEGYFQLRDLGETAVDGVAELLRVYELESIGEISTRLGLSQSRGLSRFVGRETELLQIEGLLEEVASERRGRIVAVSGNAGIGKSRLCHEFVQRCQARGIPVHVASTVPYADAMPYYPVQQLLRSYFEITESDDAAAARRKIAGALLLKDDSARDSLALVFDFLGLGESDAASNNNPPELRMQRLQALCADALAAKTELGVVLLEDVHWADSGSVEFFQRMFECAAQAPLLVLCNHRNDYVLEWLWQASTDEIALEALDEHAIDGLLGELLGNGDDLSPLSTLIRQRAAGNPYFVEEVVRSLLERGLLTGTEGNYSLTEALGNLEIPDSVQAILAARIDRLPAQDKHTLHAAAVLGKSFREDWLGRVLIDEDSSWQQSLQALVESGFVHPDGVDTYVFCHPLMQEVAYANQLGDARRGLHMRAAQALQQELEPEQEACEVAVLLAHHWHQAQQYAEAAEWDLRAASWLVQRDVVATLGRFRSALAAVEKLDKNDAGVRQMAVAARAGIVRLASIVDVSAQEVEQAYKQARAMVETNNDQAGLAELLLSYAVFILNQGDAREAALLIEEAMTILDETGDVQTLSRFRIPVLNVYFTAGRMQRGLEVLSRDGDWQEEPIDLENFASRALRAIALAYMGRITEARKDLQTALRVAASDERRVSWAHAYIVEVDYLFGRDDNSIHHAQTALISADDFGSSMFASMAKRALATAHVLRGDDALAAEVLEESRAAVSEGAAGHQFEGAHLALLAEVRLRLGEYDTARSLAEEALASSLKSGARIWEIRSRIALANVLVETDSEAQEFDQLVICLQDLIATTGATIFQGFVHSIQARWHRRDGQQKQAKLAWQQAHKCFVECGAQGRAEQAAQAIAAFSSASVKA